MAKLSAHGETIYQFSKTEVRPDTVQPDVTKTVKTTYAIMQDGAVLGKFSVRDTTGFNHSWPWTLKRKRVDIEKCAANFRSQGYELETGVRHYIAPKFHNTTSQQII